MAGLCGGCARDGFLNSSSDTDFLFGLIPQRLFAHVGGGKSFWFRGRAICERYTMPGSTLTITLVFHGWPGGLSTPIIRLAATMFLHAKRRGFLGGDRQRQWP